MACVSWTNADLLSIGSSETNASEACIKIRMFSLTKMCSKMWYLTWFGLEREVTAFVPCIIGTSTVATVSWRAGALTFRQISPAAAHSTSSGANWKTYLSQTIICHDDVINGNIFRVAGPLWGESQRPVTRSFDVFFDQCLNNRLSKQ